MHFTHPHNKKDFPIEGTGCLITEKHVVTAAHLFMIEGIKLKIKPNRIEFFPEPLKRGAPL